jgi:hypothetical protein
MLLTYTLDAGERTACDSAICHLQTILCTHQEGGWLGHKASLDNLWKITICPETKPDSLVMHPIA